jgi:hypothetical protein
VFFVVSGFLITSSYAHGGRWKETVAMRSAPDVANVDMYYRQTRPEMLRFVPATVKRVLELGWGKSPGVVGFRVCC